MFMTFLPGKANSARGYMGIGDCLGLFNAAVGVSQAPIHELINGKLVTVDAFIFLHLILL